MSDHNAAPIHTVAICSGMPNMLTLLKKKIDLIMPKLKETPQRWDNNFKKMWRDNHSCIQPSQKGEKYAFQFCNGDCFRQQNKQTP